MQSELGDKKPKEAGLPLEIALETAGVGRFSCYVLATTGLVQFSSTSAVLVMSMIIPAAGCDLGLSGYDKGMLTSSTFVGMTLASLLFGSLADQFGRRTVMMYCGCTSAFIALLASFSPDYIFLVSLWSFNGFLLAGLFSPSFVYATEFCPARIRAKSVLLPTCMGSIAAIYLPSLAWVILPLKISIPVYGDLVFTSWRLFIALLVIQTSISTYALYRLPESPKYTLNKGDEETTLRTLRRMYALNNNKSESDFPIYSVIMDDSDKLAVRDEAKSSFIIELVKILKQQLVQLLTPPLLFYTCLSCCMLCGVIGLMNVLYLWIPEQMKNLMQHYLEAPEVGLTLCQVMSRGNGTRGGSSLGSDCDLNEDIFIISIITATILTVIIIIVSFLTDRLGRKNIIVTFTTISTIGCLALMYIKDFFVTVIVNCITVVILCVTYPIGISIIVDFFPTALRSTAISITLLFGRIAASGGSQIYGALYQNHCEELYWGLFAVLASTVVFNIISPTKKKI